MNRGAVAVALLTLAAGGCGGGATWVSFESMSPPAGGESGGKRAERQGGPDPDAGKEIYRLRKREGETIRYAVALRNVTDRDLEVTGLVADEDRDGAFVPRAVAGAPVAIPAGGRGQVTVEGVVKGCRFGGQTVPMAGPELKLRDSEGEQATQQIALDMRVELVTEGC
jgi:hypothetical protein